MHVVVTGASSGIGEALVREYRRRGASVTLVARRELLEKITEGAQPGTVHIVQADLTDTEHACDWVDGAELALGPIDVLVNNAGAQIVESATATSWARAEAMLRLNVYAPLRLTQALLPRMIERRRGTIVDIASMAAIAPTPGMFFYNASKGALAAASEGLRGEVKRHGVHIVTVYPGPVESPLEAAGRAAYEPSLALKYTPTGKPSVLARRIANAVAAKRPRVIYPRFYALARHFPNLTRWLMDALTPPVRLLPR
jgi:short-subunit dehydrogenase